MKKAIIICLMLLLIATAFAERKALVMANWLYPNANLTSPKADADTVGAILSSLGFSVTRFNNLSIADFKTAIDTFAVKTKATDEVVVYYSGHGVKYNNNSYMVPSGTDIGKTQIFNKTSYNIASMADKLRQAKTSLIILEASRPWAPTGSKTPVNLSFSAITTSNPNQLIIMSAEPGKTIQDSTLSPSLFTSVLVRYMAESEDGINAFFPELSNVVLQNSNNLQKPWKSGTLKTDFKFNPNQIKGMWKNYSPMKEIEGGGSISW